MPPKKQTNGTSAEKKPAASTSAEPVAGAKGGHATKPDQAAYHAEQDRLKKQIEEVQTKLNAVKDKISGVKGGGNERRDQLRAELDQIRSTQSTNKASRSKIFDQITAMKNGIDNKVKTLNANKAKIPYKTPADVDNQIEKLTNQVESGSLKLVDERKALNEISALKRARKTVEAFQADQEDIEADRAKLDELRKQLDDPEVKAISDRFEAIKLELDEIKKVSDDAYQNRNKLFDERTALQAELDALWKEKKAHAQEHKDTLDAYWKKVNEDKARRAEKYQAQKAADEAAKKQAIAEELLEKAKHPAFAADIQDCQTLIDFFAVKTGTAEPSSASTSELAKAEASAIPKLDLRQVDNDLQGLVARKKKGEEEENYFVAKKTKKPAPKKTAPAPPPPTVQKSATPAGANIPYGILSGLMHFSIPPPANASEYGRVIEDLKTKKAWYQANQDRQTKENVAKAEAEIAKLNAQKQPAEAVADAPEAPAEVEASA